MMFFLWPDCDRQEFRHSHPSATGERRAAGVVQTWLPNHNAASSQRGTGESWGVLTKLLRYLNCILLNIAFARTKIAWVVHSH